ncbi:LytR/AlgR family response regulator transcription factor, partial [Clostridioides difficile]
RRNYGDGLWRISKTYFSTQNSVKQEPCDFSHGRFRKPLSNEKLYKTLDKIVTKLEDNESNYITIQKGYSYWKLKLADILYCEVIKRKIYVHLKKETIDYYETIENLERSLPTNFFRCHRSYIINLKYVSGYESGNAVMESGDRIPISRLRQQIFSKVMLEFMKNRRR